MLGSLDGSGTEAKFDADLQPIVSRLLKLGFREEHAHDAVLGKGRLETHGDLEKAVEWLLIHLDDAALPKRFRGDIAGDPIKVRIAMNVNGGADVPQPATSSQRLEEFGFDPQVEKKRRFQGLT